MGTSTARRGPSTAAWRLAKGAATRYLSPEGAAPVAAREVVRRYVAALGETSGDAAQDLLAGFRLTRKVAQNLADFWETATASGFPAALGAWGSPELAQEPPEVGILVLAATWVEEDGSLEAQVARTALAVCLSKAMAAIGSSRPQVEAAALVKEFLGLAFCQRLVLDLGESLEAATPGYSEYKEGLTRLGDEIAGKAASIPEPPPGPGKWQGLAGWLWVTRVLEAVLGRFQESEVFNVR